jgi:hypothetical protein
MKRSRRGLSPVLSVLLVILASAGLQCASIRPFSPIAYQYATWPCKNEAVEALEWRAKPCSNGIDQIA